MRYLPLGKRTNAIRSQLPSTQRAHASLNER